MATGGPRILERPRVIGLTGGIACGKSVVAKMLRERGVPVIDADEVAREVVEPGKPAHAEIVETFGRGVLLADGTIDRKKLGAIVFSDATARAKLNAITHPRIALASRERMAALAREGHKIVVYEAALLVENGIHAALDALIVVGSKRETQIDRLVRRDGLSRGDAEARIDAQLAIDKKAAVADETIWNDGTLEELGEKVDAAWQRIDRHLGRQLGPRLGGA